KLIDSSLGVNERLIARVCFRLKSFGLYFSP
ncbi:unnamed protein product, partial [Rotaria magnacalcarata]